jgi:hypothetical protein
VLSAEGFEVVAPQEQPCCGALLIHAGEEERALELARKTIDVFEQANVETIVTNAAGCGSNVKEYGHLLRDDPKYAARAREFAAKCKDISEVLFNIESRAARKPLALRVAFHDSCHLQHAQGVRTQPRALLAGIPGLQMAEIPEAPICCGGNRESRLLVAVASVAGAGRRTDSSSAHRATARRIDTWGQRRVFTSRVIKHAKSRRAIPRGARLGVRDQRGAVPCTTCHWRLRREVPDPLPRRALGRRDLHQQPN